VEMLARQSDLDALLESVKAFADRHRLPVATWRDAHLALDEIVSNVIRHGSDAEQPCKISVVISLKRGTLVLEVIDNAKAFDPLASVVPRTDAPLGERPIGGLGIHLVKQVMDELVYRRRAGRNHLIMRRVVDANTPTTEVP
jgi:anti-sigma regulatory factor (Ser/Thr protein kinase)